MTINLEDSAGAKLVTLIDFEDSFTYNIFSHLKQMGSECEVIHFRDSKVSERLENKDQWVILGPGPGHPSEYFDDVSLIKTKFLEGNLKLGGICLGHQLICSFFDLEIERAGEILHGQSFKYRLPNWDIFEQDVRGKEISVQRYNSLAVKTNTSKLSHPSFGNIFLSLHDDEVVSMHIPGRCLTYQFHPESVGTAHPEAFLRPYSF